MMIICDECALQLMTEQFHRGVNGRRMCLGNVRRCSEITAGPLDSPYYPTCVHVRPCSNAHEGQRQWGQENAEILLPKPLQPPPLPIVYPCWDKALGLWASLGVHVVGRSVQ